MRTTRLVIVMLMIAPSLQAQERIQQYVKSHAVQISTNHPDSTDYSDLAPIGNAIGNARIVMLGEQDHGDAPTFLAKTRLIKYLHEKKGFHILAFESDFFALNSGEDSALAKTVLLDTFLKRNIFSLWTYCDACANLFYDFIPSTQNTSSPIRMAGFDNQQILSYTRSNLVKQLDSVCRKLQLPVTKDPGYENEILPSITTVVTSYLPPTDELSVTKRSDYLVRIRNQLQTSLGEDDFWTMIADNLVAANIQYSNRKNYVLVMNTRDRQMAKNLSWLARVKYPNEKIIVWAHNQHISKYNGNYKESFQNNINSMGGFFTQDRLLDQQTYILGFTSFGGTAGRLGPKTFAVETPAKNSLERWFQPDWSFGFVDFRAYNHSELAAEMFSMKASVIRIHRNHTAYWSRIFDGVFYIKEMYPCKAIQF